MFEKSWIPIVGLFLWQSTIGGAIAGTSPVRPPKPAPIGRRVVFQPPPNDRIPDRSRGAGSRQGGQCSADPTVPDPVSLTALVPQDSIGLTAAERPALWVDLPPTSAHSILLSLAEEGGASHWNTFFPLAGRTGIIRVRPPADSPALEVGKTYRWAVVLICGDRPGPNDPAVTGFVRRIADITPPPHLTPLELAAWYADRGIWFDALESLLLAGRSSPDDRDFLAAWTDFLGSVDLEAMATRPIRY